MFLFRFMLLKTYTYINLSIKFIEIETNYFLPDVTIIYKLLFE